MRSYKDLLRLSFPNHSCQWRGLGHLSSGFKCINGFICQHCSSGQIYEHAGPRIEIQISALKHQYLLSAQ